MGQLYRWFTCVQTAWRYDFDPGSYKKSGSTTDSYTKEELNFTYMNAGYIGYFHDATAADELTATVCRIYDDKLVLSRYSEDGLIDIGSVGKNNTRYNDSAMIPATELTQATASPGSDRSESGSCTKCNS